MIVASRTRPGHDGIELEKEEAKGVWVGSGSKVKMLAVSAARSPPCRLAPFFIFHLGGTMTSILIPRGLGYARTVYKWPDQVYEVFGVFGSLHALYLGPWQPEQYDGLRILSRHAELFCLELTGRFYKATPHPAMLLAERLAGLAIGGFDIFDPQPRAAEAVLDSIRLILFDCGYDLHPGDDTFVRQAFVLNLRARCSWGLRSLLLNRFRQF